MTAAPTIIITVPTPPSANRIWRNVPGMKRPVLDRTYAKWLETAGWEARMQAVGAPRIDCRFDARIEVPISRRDTDNWAKPLMDLMEHVSIVSNDGNMNVVTVTPVDRADCLVALTVRPDLGGVRTVSTRKKRTGGPKAKPTRKRLDAIARIRAEVPF
jgi:Holliday junction resolvase RusA-like endonuclease